MYSACAYVQGIPRAAEQNATAPCQSHAVPRVQLSSPCSGRKGSNQWTCTSCTPDHTHTAVTAAARMWRRSAAVGQLLRSCKAPHTHQRPMTVWNMGVASTLRVHTHPAISVNGLPVHGMLYACCKHVMHGPPVAHLARASNAGPAAVDACDCLSQAVPQRVCINVGCGNAQLLQVTSSQRGPQYWQSIMLCTAMLAAARELPSVSHPAPRFVFAGLQRCRSYAQKCRSNAQTNQQQLLAVENCGSPLSRVQSP